MPIKSAPTGYRIALKIALSYAFYGLLWILFSDRLLAMLVSDPELLTEIQSLKGAVFVLVTALLVFPRSCFPRPVPRLCTVAS